MERTMPHGPFSSTFARLPILAAVLLPLAVSQVGDAAPLRPNDLNTLTPIKHVIIIIGENRSFDHVFGAYVQRPGQSVFNSLSQGIIRRDGSPGPNFAKATQFSAQVTSTFELAPSHN
jgi:phospholipase C